MLFKEEPPVFCDVILPLALSGTFTYRIPPQWLPYMKVGIRVEVEFGKRKHYAAIVRNIHQQAPEKYAAKEILAVLDEDPLVPENALQFWDWIAAYYVCSLGEVMQAALPSYFKLDSETYYLKNPSFHDDILDLPDDEYLVASALERQEKINLEDIRQILQKKTVGKIIKSLLDRQVIMLEEFLEDKYRPKTAVYIAMHPAVAEEGEKEHYKSLLELLSRSPKQTDIVLAYFHLSKIGEWVHKSDLLLKSGASNQALNGLIDKGIMIAEEREVGRVALEQIQAGERQLTDEQQAALAEILSFWKEKPVVMLQGVTSSGKTHIYAELILNAIAEGKQVLYLLPEIALTTQLIQRLESMIGKVGVYHSRFNPMQRVEIWQKVLKNEYQVIVGARSAVYLPFTNIGLIIVDEEHDGSYKQSEPAPRYHARDAAIYLGLKAGAKILLGSATPSLETWLNAKEEKYGKVILRGRFGSFAMPEMETVNMNIMRKQKKLTGALSEPLQDAVSKTLEEKGQVILFHNRRGFAPYIACAICDWKPMCKHCDIPLTYHKFNDALKCHFCGYSQQVPPQCGNEHCRSNAMELRGSGTERVEDDLKLIFPKAKIDRMDHDAVRSKHAYEKIIAKLDNRETDILVGTHMVTKGLDFDNIRLVGVLNADALLFYPDFRAMERAYQLLTQVAGRAGRKGDGKVMVQISQPSHPLMEWVSKVQPDEFYKNELHERAEYHYPPYFRLIRISIRDKDLKVAIDAGVFVAQQLKEKTKVECLGPAEPSVGRLNGYYIREIMLKAPKNSKLLEDTKLIIREINTLLVQYQRFRRTRMIIDVDPVY